MNRTLTLLLAAGIALFAIPTAFAHDSDIRSDWRQVQRDRARLYADQARLRDERAELAAAERLNTDDAGACACATALSLSQAAAVR
jgi:hypothetical protein